MASSTRCCLNRNTGLKLIDNSAKSIGASAKSIKEDAKSVEFHAKSTHPTPCPRQTHTCFKHRVPKPQEINLRQITGQYPKWGLYLFDLLLCFVLHIEATELGEVNRSIVALCTECVM